MYEYPFGNGQQLNLDWFLSEWKNLLAAWEAEKNGIDGALQAEIDKAEAALADVFSARDAAAQSAANALESKNAAAQSASDASGYLATVRADANTASNAAQNAAQSESNAAESAQTALASKNTAANSERNAAQSEANANSSKNAAAQSASDADASKSAAAESKDAAAQSAEDASNAAASVEASAQQIATNTGNISNLKESINDNIIPTVNYVDYVNPTHDIIDDLVITDGFMTGQGSIASPTASQEKITSEYKIIPSHKYKVVFKQPVSLSSNPWCAIGCWADTTNIFTGRVNVDITQDGDYYIGEFDLSGSPVIFRTDYIRISWRSFGSSEKFVAFYDITFENETINQVLNSAIYGIGDYRYTGEQLDLGITKYLCHKLPFQPLPPSGEIMQGIAVYNDILVQGFSSGKLQLININTGTQIALYEANAGHCGSLSFSDEFYNGNSFLPLLYVASYNEEKTFVYNITEENCEPIATYSIPAETAGYRQETAIAKNNILWCLAHKANNYSAGEALILTSWDISTYTEDGNTRIPTLKTKTELPWYSNLQCILWLNGQIFALFGSQGSADTVLRVIKQGQNDFSTVFDEFPTSSYYNIKGAEPEGLGYGINPFNGKYMLYMATRQGAFYLTIQI